MNRKVHLLIGVFVSIFIAYWIDGTFYPDPWVTLPFALPWETHYFGFSTMVYAIIGGIIGSILPDVIEPPDHYTHRSFFHSTPLMKFLLGALIVSLLIAFYDTRVWSVFYVIVGYVMHLVADGTTPMGLPG